MSTALFTHKLYNQGVAQARAPPGFHLLFAHHTLALKALKILGIYEYNSEEIQVRTDTI